MLTYYRVEVNHNPYSSIVDMMKVPIREFPNGRVIRCEEVPAAEVFSHYNLEKVLEEYRRMLVEYPNSKVSLTSIRMPN